MAAGKVSKRELLSHHLATIDVIAEENWARLKSDLAPISDSYLHSLLKKSGHPMSTLVEGVNADSLDDADRTLQSLAEEYAKADLNRKRECRAVVISAKQKLRWWLRRSAREDERRREKEEILLWTATWLENPALFSDWIGIRRRRIATEARTIPL
jgi:hypothetical protein